MDKTELLDRMQKGRAQLESALAQLSDAQMVIPGLDNNWSIKDLIGHIGWWEQRAAAIFHALAHNESLDFIDNSEVDTLNAKVFAENRARPLADVRRAERDAYQAVVSLVENAAEDDLFNPQRFEWTEGRPFAAWIEGNTYGHYEEHREALLQWIKKSGASSS